MVRLKVRYLLFEVLYPTRKDATKLDSKSVMSALRSSIETFFGDLGIGQCQAILALRYFNPQTGLGIVRVGRAQASIVQGALTYIREISGRPVVIRVTHVSGTIKKCEARALEIRKGEIINST